MEDKRKSTREFYKKYCRIMVSKLDDPGEKERMTEWLESITSPECEADSDETSDMYLELLLWALHTNRINVFPFKYPPPVDHGDIDSAYKYALEIIQMESDDDKNQGCNEVKAVVADNLKEYFAVQQVPNFGTHCFYAFSDEVPLPSWKMPEALRCNKKNELEKESNYWMKVLARPAESKKEVQPESEKEDEAKNEKDDTADKEDTPDGPDCLDINQVECILNNLLFGGKKPQNIRSFVEDDSICGKQKEKNMEKSNNVAERNAHGICLSTPSAFYGSNMPNACPERGTNETSPSANCGNKMPDTSAVRSETFLTSPRAYYGNNMPYPSPEKPFIFTPSAFGGAKMLNQQPLMESDRWNLSSSFQYSFDPYYSQSPGSGKNNCDYASSNSRTYTVNSKTPTQCLPESSNRPNKSNYNKKIQETMNSPNRNECARFKGNSMLVRSNNQENIKNYARNTWPDQKNIHSNSYPLYQSTPEKSTFNNQKVKFQARNMSSNQIQRNEQDSRRQRNYDGSSVEACRRNMTQEDRNGMLVDESRNRSNNMRSLNQLASQRASRSPPMCLPKSRPCSNGETTTKVRQSYQNKDETWGDETPKKSFPRNHQPQKAMAKRKLCFHPTSSPA